MKIHASGEDYLEAILVLQKGKGMVRSVDLARHMGFSKPSISHAVGVPRDGGFLPMDEDGFLHLTDIGREVAEKIYERHQFFTEQLTPYDRYPWEYASFPVGGAVILIEDDRLAEALNRLPQKGRDVLLMYWFLDMADREIAERMHMARRMVNTRRQKAYRLLKELMGGVVFIMSEKRRDSKGRILRTEESQRKDRRYAYKYMDAYGKPQFRIQNIAHY